MDRGCRRGQGRALRLCGGRASCRGRQPDRQIPLGASLRRLAGTAGDLVGACRQPQLPEEPWPRRGARAAGGSLGPPHDGRCARSRGLAQAEGNCGPARLCLARDVQVGGQEARAASNLPCRGGCRRRAPGYGPRNQRRDGRGPDEVSCPAAAGHAGGSRRARRLARGHEPLPRRQLGSSVLDRGLLRTAARRRSSVQGWGGGPASVGVARRMHPARAAEQPAAETRRRRHGRPLLSLLAPFVTAQAAGADVRQRLCGAGLRQAPRPEDADRL